MRPAPDQAVMSWLNGQDIQTLFLTATSLAELRFGIARLDEGRSRSDLAARLDRMLDQVFFGRIIPFDETAALEFADRMATVRRLGHAVGFQDGTIGACAAARGFAIATRDTGPFEALGVSVVNPWAAVRGT